MASRSHVDVNERRLRPIYDCLDNGNNKKAIQEADKVLKKQKDLQCAKVLKALALLRLGRQDESSVLLQGIHAQNPTDEATLQAMVICYRETHKLELIADLYGNAHKNKPDNEEILSSLFMAYVRLGDYKKQQQTAMSLHRLQPQKNPYYFWAVMSIVMQGHASPDKKLAKTMFLPLAERMAKRYVDEEKISSEAEVQLYLIILEMLEKSEEALNVIKGPLGEKLTSEIQFQDRKAAELYRKLERWPETNAAYKSLLKQNPDHWEFWQEYISSCMKLSVSGWTPTGDLSELDADYTEDMAAVFIEESIKNQTNGRLMRGPYLARLELTKQMRDLGQPKTDRLGSPQKLLEEYYQLFGDKCCCFDDMRMFTDLLSTSGKEEVIQTLSKSVDLPDIEKSLAYASSRNQMQRHLTSLQLSYHIGMYDNYGVNDRLAVCREFICRYQHGLQFGKDLLTTDIQFSDNYLLLAVYILISLWEETGEVKYLWQAIVQLEKGTKNSPSNFRIKVLLIRLYCIQGVYGPSHKLYESLEAKHIMNDTLGHIVANHVGRLGFFAAACSIYGTMLRFFAVNHKETAEYLLASYKYGSFNKICEFVKFREKLQNSLQYACATVESMLLDLVQETDNHGNTEQIIAYMEIDPAQDKTHFDDVCDNRDFTLMASWTPTKYVMKDAVSHSFKEEKAWLKVRNLTLRILAGSVILGQQAKPSNQTNNGIDHDKKPIHEVIQDLSEQLAQHVQWCQEEFTTDYEYPLQGPFRTRLSKYLCDSHSQVFHAMVQNVQYLYSLQEDRLEKTDNEKEEEFKTRVPDLLTGLITKHSCSLMQKDGDRQSLNPSVLENLVFTAETLSHATVMAGVCHRILKPLKSAWNKKSRKQKGDNPAPLPCTFGNFSQLLIGMEKAAKELHLAVRELDPIFLSLDLSSLSLTDSLQDSEEDKVIEREMWKKVESSYQVSSREVSEFVHNKMQYLNSLKL